MQLTDYHAKYFAHELINAQDEIDRQGERLIAEIEGKLQQKTLLTMLFTIRWRLQ